MKRISHEGITHECVISLLYMYCEEPMHSVTQVPAMMLRCLITRGGIIAVLGSNPWIAQKVTSNTPARVNNAMMRALLHWILSTHRDTNIMVSGNSQHMSGHPTEVPTEDRSHQVPEPSCQGNQVASASPSRGAWLCLDRGP